jgi:hypothetical protein
MSVGRRGRLAVLALGLVLLAVPELPGLPAAAEEIGEVARITPRAIAYPPPERRLVELKVKDPIERGAGIRLTDEGSYLLVAFNFGGGRILAGKDTTWVAGTAVLAGKAEATFGDPLTFDSRLLLLSLGRLWLNLLPGQGPLAVRTPHAVVRLRGTSVRFFVEPAAGTFVAVDEGTVEIQAEDGGSPLGPSISLTAGHWAWVPRGGFPSQPDPATGAAGAAGVVGTVGGLRAGGGGLADAAGAPTEPPFGGCCPGGRPPQ